MIERAQPREFLGWILERENVRDRGFDGRRRSAVGLSLGVEHFDGLANFAIKPRTTLLAQGALVDERREPRWRPERRAGDRNH